MNYSIVFEFSENKYFTNKQLIKKIICDESTGEPLEFIGNEI